MDTKRIEIMTHLLYLKSKSMLLCNKRYNKLHKDNTSISYFKYKRAYERYTRILHKIKGEQRREAIRQELIDKHCKRYA